MTLSTRTRLSHYEITSQIGKGGMGEVYQAKDQKLGRDVAIKVLPEEFAQDADRVARFQREAKLLASLNHPNIAAIHGLEEVDGTNFLVMELVDGQTLDERIKSGSIPVEDALKLALQIAEAIEAAHEKGVIHRDLKPANIKVTPDGKVKVLDFGLAKAFAGEQADLNLSNSPTLSHAATMQGVILGTAAYMSPEQARGKEVDKRADIWAFGVVLFEMLTGKQVFTGETVSDTLASVLAREPEWQGLPLNLHPRIRLLIERCLKKDPKSRYHDIADVRVDIQEVLDDPSGILSQPVATVEPEFKKRKILAWAATTVILIIITGIAAWKLKPPPPPGKIVRFTYPLGEERFTRTMRPVVDISSDGTQLAYVADQQIWLRKLSENEARPVVGTDEYPSTPFFSPNGEYIGFWSAEGELKWIHVAGGTPITITKADNPYGVWWGEDDSIVYGADEGVWRVSIHGGTPELIVETQRGKQIFGPQILPGNKYILYSVSNGTNWDEAEIVVENIETNERTMVWKGGSDPHYVPTGHIVFAFKKDLYAIRFDLETLVVGPGQFPIIHGLSKTSIATGTAHYSISDGGTLVYVPETGGEEELQCSLTFVDRGGNPEVLPAPLRNYEWVRLSPDGERIALEIETGIGISDIWIYNISDGILNQLTSDGGGSPLWTPDGKEITYLRDGSLWNIRSDFSGEETPLDGTDISQLVIPSSWSPDGQVLLFSVIGSGIYSWTREGDKPGKSGGVELIVPNPEDGYVSNPTFSPDGRWFIFSSVEETTEPQLHAYPFPMGKAARQTITTDGGVVQVWPKECEEILFLNPRSNSMSAMNVKTGPILTRGNPVDLFPIDSSAFLIKFLDYPIYDVSRDGERFLFCAIEEIDKPDGDIVENQLGINVVLNWFEELKEKVPVP